MATRGKAMRGRKHIYANTLAADRICLMLAAAVLMLAVLAATARAHSADPTDWVPVSMNAGENYVINDIKPGTKPLFKVEQNPNAFVTYDSPPGKLTMLSAGAGRWIVTVTNTSDREVSYDVNAFGAAKPGAPLTPGKAPMSMSDDNLAARPGEGASNSTSSAMPELETIPSLHATPSVASPYSLTLPDKAPLPYEDASWNVPPQPDKGAQAYESSLSIVPSATSAARYR